MNKAATVTIEGESWRCELTAQEYAAWDLYAESHPWLFQGGGTEPILAMFLSHYRRGINLNEAKATINPTTP